MTGLIWLWIFIIMIFSSIPDEIFYPVFFTVILTRLALDLYKRLKANRARDAKALDYIVSDWATVPPPGDRGRDPYVGEVDDWGRSA